jgi:hypothetical protein
MRAPNVLAVTHRKMNPTYCDEVPIGFEAVNWIDLTDVVVCLLHFVNAVTNFYAL